MSKNKFLAIALTGFLIGPEVLGVAHLLGLDGGKAVAQANANYQQPLPPNPAATSNSPTYQQPLAPQPTFSLKDGAPIKLKIKKSISSKTAAENDIVEMEAAEDVRIGNTVVIAKGADAKGIVTEVKRGKRLGRKGKLSIAVKEVTLASGERIPLRAQQSSGGGLSAGVIAGTILLSPLFLLMGGRNVTYKEGSEFTAYVEGNYLLTPAKFGVVSPR